MYKRINKMLSGLENVVQFMAYVLFNFHSSLFILNYSLRIVEFALMERVARIEFENSHFRKNENLQKH